MSKVFVSLLVAISGLVVLLACGESGHTISKSDYGSRWPLTVSEATLHCEEVEVWNTPNVQLVWVESKGYAYPVNGTAKSFLRDEKPGLKVRDIERIWRSHPTISGMRINIMPLINDGLEIC